VGVVVVKDGRNQTKNEKENENQNQNQNENEVVKEEEKGIFFFEKNYD